MKTVYSPAHRLQHGQQELFGNRLVPCYEHPGRIDAVHAAIARGGPGEIIEPRDFGMAPVLAVHAADYVAFLRNAWEDWRAAGGEGEALPSCTPMPDMGRRVPESIHGRIAYYSFDATAPITAGTWPAAYAAAQSAVTGAHLLMQGERAAFVLCRPPGHHASRAYYGGYCFLNNAAIAAQNLVDNGARRIAILDVDYHHGNGTQSIFYERGDVLFVSVHADPRHDYPFFLGHADEVGSGDGTGFNLNLPLAQGCAAETWFEALDHAVRRIRQYGPEALIVSLGVDTYEADPIAHFRLKTGDYTRLGATLAGLHTRTLFVMEGGYAVDAIGSNVCNVLTGFLTDPST